MRFVDRTSQFTRDVPERIDLVLSEPFAIFFRTIDKYYIVTCQSICILSRSVDTSHPTDDKKRIKSIAQHI